MAKATANCVCKKCGKHFEKESIRANRREADSWEKWASSYYDVCDECEAKERMEENEKSGQEAEEKGWVRLVGTDKQISWANEIRAEMISKIEDIICEEKMEKQDWMLDPQVVQYFNHADDILQCLKLIDNARWFIDHRKESAGFIASYIASNMTGLMEEVASRRKDADNQTKEKEEQEEKDLFIASPIEKEHDGVVEIKIVNDVVSVYYQKDSAYNEIVKSLDYSWDSGVRAWTKHKSFKTGDLKERVAELGNKLLNAGFTVSMPDQETLQWAIDAKYEPECQRWISLHVRTGKLMICWTRQDRNFYDIARRIPQAKWQDGCMLVPPIEYRSVLEFAETYGFRLSPGAQKKIDEIEGKSKIVAPKAAKEAQYDEHPISDVLNSSREVLDDLKDDD